MEILSGTCDQIDIKKSIMKSSGIMLLGKAEKRKSKTSLTILSVLDASINETTRVAKKALENCHCDNSQDNWHMMNCVYAFLILRTSSFYDELQRQFLKISELKKSRALISAIHHFNTLYRHYRVRNFRHFLAHNRKEIGKKKGKRYRPISDADIARISRLKSHTEFESFGVATSRIIQAIESL
jgi:hypothetical protein